MFRFLNLQYLFYRIYSWVFEPVSGIPSGSSLVFSQFLVLLRLFCIFLGGAFLVGLVYALIKLREVRKKSSFVVPTLTPDEERPPRQGQWEEVKKHAGSENPSDWKLAILEADTILDELLRSLAIPGETVGEKLKNVVPGDFRTLDDAWEAHKVRNKIAHEGLNFGLTKREARLAIDRFERVFLEFGLIRKI
ncbi:MAG: hypothetical protein V4674_03440 [Patescibacteria group bacterium]